MILTSKNNRHVKDHWDVYKYISSYRKHPEFDGQTTELPLNIRVVRFKAACEGMNHSLPSAPICRKLSLGPRTSSRSTVCAGRLKSASGD
ncbi:hypothetical protein [Allobaculum mucilyticum]|uniref:hypothetical protein n=1 Tax=Allobaculum mucilyticum TaxID=2834459 RepID=UPI001F620359|nr:hypothetical protein [Allobaculum mucilyticum]UNT97483.1 hypothetical protein KWG62_01945 [Allobaculum mucilyticum]